MPACERRGPGDHGMQPCPAGGAARAWIGRCCMTFKRSIPLIVLLLAQPGLVSAQDASAERGRALFQRQCLACHQLAQPRNGVGPTLQGVFGRGAGTVAGFTYSPALKTSGITWTRESLDGYLANPMAAVRGTRMAQRVPDELQRGDIIEFLATP